MNPQHQSSSYFSFFFLVDVLTVGPWETLRALKGPELARLATFLPGTVLGSRANSTTVKFMYAFQRWKRWAEPRHEVAVFPVQEVHFALYLQHLAETTRSKASVEEAVNAIGWIHQLSGLSPIAASPFLRATLEGLQRQLAKPKARKEPITPDMLLVRVESLGPSPSLAEVRLATIALLAFSAFTV